MGCGISVRRTKGGIHPGPWYGFRGRGCLVRRTAITWSRRRAVQGNAIHGGGVSRTARTTSRLLEDKQQRRDGDHGDRRGDQDRAGGTGDVDVVLAGDDKDVRGDRERRAEQGCSGPEGVDGEDHGGRKKEGRGV